MEIIHRATDVLVRDIRVSAVFYEQVLSQRILLDETDFILFEGGLAMHQADELVRMAYGESRASAREPQGHDNILIYFETDDLQAAYDRVLAAGADILHPIKKQAWGQLVFRFRDPDGHIVEIGEPQTT